MRLPATLFVIGVILSLGVVLALAGPAHAQQNEAGDPVRGAQLYSTYCAVCHGETGEGRVGATLTSVFASISPSALMEQVITAGREGTAMPAWGEAYGGPLTDADIQDVIAYINSWGTASQPPAPAPPLPAVEIPPVPEVDGDPNVGYTLFQQNCAACHGEQGEGRVGASLNSAFAAIYPGAFTIETVKRGIPGSLMPPFAQSYGGPLTDQQINDVAAYVLSLERPSPSPVAEIVGRADFLPLLILLMAVVVVIFVLGLLVRRREERHPPGPT
jgi:cytochrome c oxidase cbb3-type subunit 3/ubiquinol-cytochrome c reductase cytochrome c subunit